MRLKSSGKHVANDTGRSFSIKQWVLWAVHTMLLPIRMVYAKTIFSGEVLATSTVISILSLKVVVFLYTQSTDNTFEERIDAMIQSKKHLAEMTVAADESWIGKLSNKELHDIFERE